MWINYLILLVRTPGLEPGRDYSQGILSPLRLPFRHVRAWASHHRAIARFHPRGGVSNYFDNNWLQAGSQSLPLASTTRPSCSKNLLGIWNMAMNVPPFGLQATCRLPAGRQTNSPGPTSTPASGPSLSTSEPSST